MATRSERIYTHGTVTLTKVGDVGENIEDGDDTNGEHTGNADCPLWVLHL